MSLSHANDRRIAATAFGNAFGVRVGAGRDLSCKSAPAAPLLAPEDVQMGKVSRRKLTAAQANLTKRLEAMIGAEGGISQKFSLLRDLLYALTIALTYENCLVLADWKGLLSMERDAVGVASALRRTCPADAMAIYGFLGHAHLMAFPTPVAIYADHGGIPGKTILSKISLLNTQRHDFSPDV
jgi:hypothetical protein